MQYFLIHRFGQKDKPQFRKVPYTTESEAIISAGEIMAAGGTGEFLVEDEKGNIIRNDAEIRSRCNQPKIP